MAAHDAMNPQQFIKSMPGVNKLEDSPLWPIRMAFDSRSWSEAPVEDVPISSLHRTQGRVFKKYLGGKGDDRTQIGRDKPWVMKVNGQNWLADGHHRVADAAVAGDKTISSYTRTQPD